MIICDICTPLKPFEVLPSAFYLKISSLWIISPSKSVTISVTISDFSPFCIPCIVKWNNKYRRAQVMTDSSSKYATSYLGAQEGFFCFTSWSLWSSLISEGILETTYLEGTLSLWEKCCRNQLAACSGVSWLAEIPCQLSVWQHG